MPIYEYEHLADPCSIGEVFEFTQPISAEPLTLCPVCEGPVRRIISRCGHRSPKSNTELRDLGFSKLVKRDKGVYENVSAGKGEPKIINVGD